MKFARIVGTGSALPKRVLTNKELESMTDTTDEWIRTRTGIQKRHIVSPDETCVSLSSSGVAGIVMCLCSDDDSILVMASSSVTPFTIIS